MLAQNKKPLTFMLMLAVAMTTSFVFGQQPQLPSQRYQPVPPSVHIPPQNTERIQLQQAKNRLQANGIHPQNVSRSASYNFSDSQSNPPFERGTIQQTSYVTEGEVQVPNILVASNQNTPQQPATSPTSTKLPPLANGSFASRQFNPVKATSEPASAPASAPSTEMVETIQRSQPQVDPHTLKQQQEMAKNQLMQIRQRAEQAANQLEQAAMDLSQTATPSDTGAEAMKNEEIARTSATSEISAPITLKSDQVDDESTASTETPMLKAKPVHVASNAQIGEPVNHIRRVSSESTAPRVASKPVEPKLAPEISLTSPGIEVQTFGPRTIGINKTSTYRIVVANLGATDAKQILIGINMPQWVDIANTNMTNGQKEITDGVNQARLVWTVANVPAHSNQTITIDTVPRKAEMFDLGVEWTLAPRTGMTSIEVTEPRLEMKIAGPRDVLYGEKAIYHVTVRNPGTGTAENVSVMLPEALGGERASLGEIEAGREKNFQVELLARTAGQLDLAATAKADGDLNTQAVRQITVRRANLGVIIDGPPMKYAGSVGAYTITINNTGDATAQDVVAAIALPVGVKYLGGVDNAKEIEGGLRWQVGTIDSGDQRTFKINCELNSAGDLQVEAGARGQGDLAASSACVTTVETVADLVLSVMDPKGPLPTGEDVTYQIRVKNRGTRAAQDVQLVMQFSEGIEPNSASGLKHRVVPGQILFSPITQVDPDEEMTFQVTARAHQPGTHVFRAQLTCADSDSREIAEGTTRFFGDIIEQPVQNDTSTADASNEFGAGNETSDFDR